MLLGEGRVGQPTLATLCHVAFAGGWFWNLSWTCLCSPEMIYALFDSLLFDLPDFKATVIPLEKPEIFPKQWILKCKHTHTRWTSACCFFCRALLYSLASLPALPGQVLTPRALNITNPSTPQSSHVVCISREADVWEHRSTRCCHPSALFKSHRSSTSEVSFFLFLELFAFWALGAALCFTGEFCLVGC